MQLDKEKKKITPPPPPPGIYVGDSILVSAFNTIQNIDIKWNKVLYCLVVKVPLNPYAAGG